MKFIMWCIYMVIAGFLLWTGAKLAQLVWDRGGSVIKIHPKFAAKDTAAAA